MGALLQSPIVLTVITGVLVLFAFSLFGLWELKLPGALNLAAGKTYSGYFGSLFMGPTFESDFVKERIPAFLPFNSTKNED